MKGHYRPHSDRWRVWYDIGPDPVTGRRRQRTKIVATEEEAQRLLDRIARDRNLGSVVDPHRARTRIDDFVVRYLAARIDLEQSTLVGYESKLRVHVVPKIGGQQIGHITPDLLAAMYSRLLSEGVSPATVKAVHRVLRSMFSRAVAWKYIPDNPAATADTPKVPAKGFATWTPAELARFIPVALEHRWGIGYLLSASTGMRRGEVLGLKWENVDLEEGLISVRSTRLEVRGHVIDKPTPKSAQGERTIPVDATVAALLRAERQRQRKERLRLGPVWTDSGFVVVNPDGNGIKPNSYSQAFRLRLLPKAGLPYMRLHDLRHTWGTLMTAEGVDPKTVSQMLGHSTVNFTLNVYVHGSDQGQRQAAETMGRLLRGG